jgi:penicillin-insensitive murein endopeptidase
MSWRPGEVWLDVDAWVIPGDAAAAVVPRLVPPLPFAAPPGLAASRERRLIKRRRRRTRRARATAIALSPAVVVALAGLRGERDAAGRVLVDDPPSATLRLATPRTPVPLAAIRAARAREPAAAAAADRAPVIRWRRAQSLGLPHHGRLVGGTQLPVAGPDWLTWNPVTDRSPNAPGRLYGHERVIRAIVSVARAYRAGNPGAPRVVVGDISRRGGGPMRDEHISHQNGLDVDVYFPRRDGTLRAARTHDQIDHRLAQDLLDRFVAAGAEIVFVGRSTGLRGPVGVVVPYAGHEYHMHVRFRLPA